MLIFRTPSIENLYHVTLRKLDRSLIMELPVVITFITEKISSLGSN